MDFEKVFLILEKTHQPTMLEILKDYTPFQLLVATLLSARTKDARLIPIVKDLFVKYPGPKELSEIKIKELEKILYQVGFFRVKARNVIKLSKIVLDNYSGEIPKTLPELTTLPGVGRKTANCVLAYCFGKPAIAVDIHVHRISNRLGWINTKTPEESEMALMNILPKELWVNTNRLLVGHGQTICKPIGPLCVQCPIIKFCKYGGSLVS